MNFFDVIEKRRSVRKYSSHPVPAEIMNRAIDAALLAPNSSNMQTWQFYWVKNSEKKEELRKACLSQSAAITAQELLVVSVNPTLWSKTAKDILDHAIPQGFEKPMGSYYGKLMPFIYGQQYLAPLKWLFFNIAGLFKPVPRKPWSLRDREEVCIKSAALACENFMLAITAQGFDTCPMEGFDEMRVKKLLGLKCSDRIVMVISVGERLEAGVWGPRYRSPRDWFVFEV